VTVSGSASDLAHNCTGCGRALSRYNAGERCHACVSAGRQSNSSQRDVNDAPLVNGPRKPSTGLARRADVIKQRQGGPERYRPTMLRALIIKRHWQRFRTFEAQFRRAAREVAERESDPNLAKMTISSRQWERWYSGAVKTMPHPDACRVLEHMFGHPVQELLAIQGTSKSENYEHDLMRPFPNSLLTTPAVPPIAPHLDELRQFSQRQLDSSDERGFMPTPAALARRSSRVEEALQTAIPDTAVGLSDADLDAASETLSGLVEYYAHVVSVAPSPRVYDDLLGVRMFASSLLGRAGRDRRRSDLVVTAGWLSSLLAASAADIGEHAAALVWCSDMEHHGRDAGHPELLGWAALTRALIAHYHGQGPRSLALACHGKSVTALGSVVHAKLAAQEMRARAALGDAAGMARAKRYAATAMERLTPDSATAGAFSIPRAEDPPYTATSLLLIKDHRASAETTRRIIETVYRTHVGSPAGQPTKYARTLLILGLAEAGLGCMEEASAAGSRALECAYPVWPTLVLAGRLNDALTHSAPKAIPAAADYHARYLDAAERLAKAQADERVRRDTA
jgi:hypothetical protein